MEQWGVTVSELYGLKTKGAYRGDPDLEDQREAETETPLDYIRANSEPRREEARTARKGPRPVPQYERASKPRVPARALLHKKTIAFGGTVNVSQTVERKKPPAAMARTTRATTKTPPAPPRAGEEENARIGRIPTDKLRGQNTTQGHNPQLQHRTPLANYDDQTTMGIGLQGSNREAQNGKENITPQQQERLSYEDILAELDAVKTESAHKDKAIAAVTEQCDRTDRAMRLLRNEFDRLVVVFKESIPPVPSSTVLVPPPRRGPLTPSQGLEDLEERHARHYGSPRYKEIREEQHKRKVDKNHNKDDHLLNHESVLAAVRREYNANPMFKQTLQDIIDEARYQRKYGDGRKSSSTSPSDRDSGRKGTRMQRSHERYNSVSLRRESPRHRGSSRKTTPSRRRVTERVTIEREHHFDDDSSEEEQLLEMYSEFVPDPAQGRGRNCRRSNNHWDNDVKGPLVMKLESDEERAKRDARIEEIRKEQARRREGRR